MAGFGYRKRDDLPLIAITAFFIVWTLILLYSPLGPFSGQDSKVDGGLADSKVVVAYNPDNLMRGKEEVEPSESSMLVPDEPSVPGKSGTSQNGAEMDPLPGDPAGHVTDLGSETGTDHDVQVDRNAASGDGAASGLGTALNDKGEAKALLAFIIDDWGYNWSAADGFLHLDAPMTYAILPYQKHSREHAEKAKSAGYEVILHLPMEPTNPEVDPGPKAIRVMQDEEEIRQLVLAGLAQVPEAVGVNNHMGSGVTEDARVMRIVLETLAEQGKYFIDSHTSGKTVVPAVAKEVGIAFGQNQVFIDNQADPEYVKERIRLAANVARENGYAIAIGHVKAATLAALQEMIPLLKQEGIQLVTVSQLLARISALTNAATPEVSEKLVETAGEGVEVAGEATEAVRVVVETAEVLN